ncbi:MAG: sugar ABC transporter ATP-binding protein [Clostridiales bacterium]|nr:sugar ABC transporter ATP-binding protein [Clostridiales bacterium]
MEPILTVRGMDKSFGATVALRQVDIDIYPGEIRGLIGENGSGKSTLTSIIAGIHKADAGSMAFHGRPWQPVSMINALEHGIGMIVQETGTIPGISVAENLFLGETGRFRSKLGLVSRADMEREARKALDVIHADHIRPGTLTSMLDLQERKLVEVAKVMVKKPEILIVDETTTALSQTGRELLYKLMDSLKREGKAVIFISHDLDEIKQVCDTLTVLRDGKIITHFSKENYDDDAIKTSMIGREMQGDYYRADNEPSWRETVLLKAEHLNGSGLKDVSLEVRAGEILGIGGLSECGMHTLGKALFGCAQLTGGTVETEGRKYSDPKLATKLGVGYVSKERDTESLCQQASIRDNISIAGLDRIKKHKLVVRRRETAYVGRQVDALSIKCRHIEQPVSAMSGGNKQKVVFGKWLGAGSRVLILDCPTRGVDIGVKQSMYQLIVRMKNEGKAILIISEEMAELIGMCDQLLVMKDGAVQTEFLRGHMNEADIIRYMI